MRYMFRSLKAKILIIMLAVTLVTSSLLLYFFLNFYKKDKTAYLFDTAASVLETHKDMYQKEMTDASALLKKHLDHLAVDQKLALHGEAQFDPDYLIDAIWLFRKNPNLSPIDRLAKLKLSPQIEKKLTELSQNSNSLGMSTTITAEQVYVVHNLNQNGENWVVIYTFHSDALKNFYKGDQLSNVALIAPATGVLGEAYKDIAPQNVLNFNSNLLQKIAGKLTQDSYTSLQKINQAQYLISATKLFQSDSYLVTFLTEEKAFHNVQMLVQRSILFFVILSVVVLALSLLLSHYLTHRLKILTDSVAKISAGNFDIQVRDSGRDEVSTLSSGVNKMTKEISRLMSETANKARMESELKTAQAVQSTLFPPDTYSSSSIKIRGHYISASECGGDWWYYSEKTNTTWIWIADATGHGAPAALLTSAAKSAVSVVEEMQLPIDLAFTYVNTAICSVAKENMMMTCFLAVIDKATQKMTYINASHEPTILIKKTHELSKDDLIYLNENSCPRLGQAKDSRYISNQIQLNSGDRIIFYTDGVMDITNEHGKSYGERGFRKELITSYNTTKALDDYFTAVTTHLNDYQAGTELIDDVTLCFVEVQ